MGGGGGGGGLSTPLLPGYEWLIPIFTYPIPVIPVRKLTAWLPDSLLLSHSDSGKQAQRVQ